MKRFALFVLIGSACGASSDSTGRRACRSSSCMPHEHNLEGSDDVVSMLQKNNFQHAHNSSSSHAAEEHTIVAANNTRNSSTPEQLYGDLTCMRYTGGTCWMSGCKSSRGPTVCEEGKCLCAPGTCANAEGACDHRHGKWLGSYSIGFVNPYNPKKSYVGIASNGASRSFFDPDLASISLASTSDSRAAWKIALMPEGRVRFESVSMPEFAMHLYVNRRRRDDNNHVLLSEKKQEGTLKETSNATGSAEREPMQMIKLQDGKVVLPDDDDIWPILVSVSEASPLDVTFQVRPTPDNGGGLEIWDPQTRTALAGADPEWWFKDHVAAKGITECSEGLVWASDCEGRQLVSFDPELPIEARPNAPRADIHSIGGWSTWQYVLLFGCLGCCVCAAAFIFIGLAPAGRFRLS